MFKTRNIAYVANAALSMYAIFETVRDTRIAGLRQFIQRETSLLYRDCQDAFKNTFRDDGILIISTYDHCYKVFSKDLHACTVDSDLVFVQNRGGRLGYTHIRKEADVFEFANAHPESIYFTASAHSIKAMRILCSGVSAHSYLLNNFYGILKKPRLPVLFEGIYKRVCGADGESFEMSEGDVAVKLVKTETAKTLHIDFRDIGVFSQTIYTGEMNAFFSFYVDMKYIFARNIEQIRSFTSKWQWLDSYASEVLNYLYEQKMILTRDFERHPDLAACLLPFKFISNVGYTFKEGEVVRGGICFTRVFEKQHLMDLIDAEMFEEYRQCVGTIFFTSFAQFEAKVKL